MEPRISFVTLGVEDLQRSIRFYEDVLKLSRLPSSPRMALFEMGPMRLALYPRAELAADAGVSPEGSGFARFTLSHNVQTALQVDLLLDELAAAGEKIIKPPRKTEWGGYAGYFADPDGFLWEVVWNPKFPHL